MVLGGVGRNLAAALELLGNEPTFVTSLAGDNLGEFARGELAKLFSSSNHSNGHDDQQQPARRVEILKWTGSGASSSFALVLIDSLSGQCEFVIANLEAQRAISRANLESLFGPEQQLAPVLRSAPLLILDANLPQESVEFMLQLGHRSLVPVFIEPTDVNCLPSLVQLLARLEAEKKSCRHALACLSPNAIELETMLKLFAREPPKPAASGRRTVDDIRAMARELMQRYLPQLTCLLVTLDSRGVLVGLRTDLSADEIDRLTLDQLWRFNPDGSDEVPTEQIVFKHFPPSNIVQSPVSASGAGDCFAAAFMSGAINGRPLRECIEFGFEAARYALLDTSTVPESLAELN